MRDFEDFKPQFVNGTRAYSAMKGLRMAVVTLATLNDIQVDAEDDDHFGYVALLAFETARDATPEQWLTMAQKAGYPNQPSDDAREACVQALAHLADMDVPADPEPVEAVA